MIVICFQLNNAPNKLQQQFTKCNFFGCEHPLFEYENYATSEELFQEITVIFRLK
ncbi:hypothetical protein [Anaerofustis butyriciformans]|uniref:hypothetical protein n=1 Tax=Anaerofustis butyriciformans TaxID=3108533 RepID=UPI002E326759|nr:hypothetical protein [Anaerofustis sp. HA2171]